MNPINVREKHARTAEIERGIAGVCTHAEWRPDRPAGSIFAHRDLVITLAARHRLPTVYPDSIFVADGGLIARARPGRSIPTGGGVWPHPQGREARRPAGAGTRQI